MSAVCDHIWEYVITMGSLVDYGGPIVAGSHDKYRCTKCGKTRMRAQHGWRLIKSRKDNIRHRQLQLL